MRKTIPVEDVIEMVNNFLASNPDEPLSEKRKARREGASLVLEYILHATGNYEGFRYLSNLQGYVVPGVFYDKDGPLPYPERFENTDDSRRQY